MRIISVQPAPVARIFTFTYAVCGLVAFLQYAFSSMQTFILPIGILMGVFHLNMNFQLGRSPDLLANAFLCVGAVLSYALSGWITGVALTLCVNFIARKTGGIDAKFVTVAEDAPASPATVPVS
jgi:hypothetical protein